MLTQLDAVFRARQLLRNMNSQTRLALMKLSNSVSAEHLGWMRVAIQYSLDIPCVKMEADASFFEIYELVEESVACSEAPWLMMKVLNRLHISCLELQECEASSGHRNNMKLEFVLTIMDIVRDLLEPSYEELLCLARRRYFQGYHRSKLFPRFQLVRRLLDKDIIGPTNFGIVYAYLERIHSSRQHCKLDRYCEEQGLEKPAWKSLCLQIGLLWERVIIRWLVVSLL